jgi:nucleoid DNA-binding protein
MIPKKASKLYKEVSEDLNIEESLVENLIEFYYREVRNAMTELKHPKLVIEGLGNFVIKPYAVRKAIPRYIKTLDDHDTSTFNAYYNKKSVESKLDALIKIEEKIVEEENSKETFLKRKDEYLKKNMERPEQDS